MAKRTNLIVIGLLCLLVVGLGFGFIHQYERAERVEFRAEYFRKWAVGDAEKAIRDKKLCDECRRSLTNPGDTLQLRLD
jgi:hypothetical protein